VITPLPVLLDAQSLGTGVVRNGVATYTTGLLPALAAHRELQVRALCAPGTALPEGVGPVTVHRRSARPRALVIENSLRLALEVRRAGGLFHNLTYHSVPALRSPWVQTLHDVIPVTHPSPDLAALRARWNRFAPRYRRAAAIIAVSRHAADDGIAHLDLDPTRVHVVHHGVAPAYRPAEGPADPPYLLMVGEYSPRKGYPDAFALLDALVEAGYPHRLVVVGWDHGTGQLAALRGAARHPERIELHWLVPDVVPLYQGATALLMASRSEGFGLPALEAMACGVPVVAYANTALTEIAGPAALMVPDGSVDRLLTAVKNVLDTPALRADLHERGIAHARGFTWERSAALHAEVYAAVSR
jgi:glycosyltransferase involved in cell wall biosynthesis